MDAPLADGAEGGGPGGLRHVGLVVPEVAERAVDGVDAGGEELPPERFPAMLELLDQGLEEGALGIGLAVQYYPGATRREIFEVFRFAGEQRATIHTHVRSMTIEAMQEVLANAVATAAPLHIVHVNSMALGEIDTVLDLIGGARRLGLDVTTEAYPYTAGSTSLHSSIFDEGWQDRLGIGYGDLQWEATGERLTKETFERYRRERGTVILHFMQEAWIGTALGNDWVIVASDGMPYAPKAHPRTAGTYSRVLGRYVRERGVTARRWRGLRRGVRLWAVCGRAVVAGHRPRRRRVAGLGQPHVRRLGLEPEPPSRELACTIGEIEIRTLYSYGFWKQKEKQIQAL